MRLDPMHLEVDTFPTEHEETSYLMVANSQMPCGASTSPCLDSQATCDPRCIA